MMHLSRLAEDLIIYSSRAFGYVELADAYSTGSSLMPQKKNPDALELIRGKSGRVLGTLTAALTLLKGLPLSYNRDLQEDKAALFDGVDSTRDSLQMAARVVRTLHIHPEHMRAATGLGFLTATDVADELVRRGVPFAEAHEQVGKLVRHCDEQRKTFSQISVSEAKQFVPSWDITLSDVATSPEMALQRRNVVGGTAPAQVARQLRAADHAAARLRRRLARRS
jgi:argininosuccinate lyase